eukprot:CAMPEP_0201556646 /NCGR_PEP_ID=MMETSP0173_2-20130828/56841_1 /ASSEMBLY_ACC=CAM_ASM_000268 /TAXON_ID=218659 /ORGANISM="Vexillifera sp., Strain DIVA3 564/2" /LENGTH=284 /DNA_ID=CAMNT_0047969043 /DNA_START=45 /DNA_END=895 /DNA_ORIENTATION=-
MSSITTVAVWLRNDLRLIDNRVIQEAMQRVRDGEFFLPVFTVDQLGHSPLTGIPRVGDKRAQFQVESIMDLKKSLKRIGSDLLVAVGRPEEVFKKLRQELGVRLVVAASECCTEEKQDEKRVGEVVDIHLVKDANFMYPFSLYTKLFGDRLQHLSNVFTPARKVIESASVDIPQPLPAPKRLPPVPSREVMEGCSYRIDFEPTMDTMLGKDSSSSSSSSKDLKNSKNSQNSNLHITDSLIDHNIDQTPLVIQTMQCAEKHLKAKTGRLILIYSNIGELLQLHQG